MNCLKIACSNSLKMQFGMVLNVVFTPFKDIILASKTKQVDDVSFHCFTINFNGLFEYSNVSIWISIFDISWVL